MEIVNLGSIYLGGTVQTPGFDCGESESISLGDTAPGREIHWVKLQSGLLIADRCVCTGVSWKQLNEKSFVFGTPITIDGETYWCRCLKVGVKEDDPNEWDAALDEAGEDNTLWHWKNEYFWGQETSKYVASNRACRGCYSARFWNNYTASHRFVNVGFRPALESLGSVPCSPDTLMGKAIKAYFPGGATIEGLLVDFSDYDIVLRSSTQPFADFPRAMKDGCNLVVSRENIIWLKET